jgi:hypothetical protein
MEMRDIVEGHGGKFTGLFNTHVTVLVAAVAGSEKYRVGVCVCVCISLSLSPCLSPSMHLTSTNTHTHTHTHTHTQAAVKFGTPVVTKRWVEACLQEGKVVDTHTHTLPALKGMSITSTGFTIGGWVWT